MKVAFYTLGCKVNQYETQVMREMFENAGYTLASKSDIPDLLIINSCTVTAESDRKTRQTVRRFRKSLPKAIILLTGCMVQAFPEKSAMLYEADIVAGNTDISLFPSLVQQFITTGTRVVNITPHNKDEVFNTPEISDFSERTRAYIKIEDGCERYCTYCIIPKARGVVRSRPIEDIKAEATQLAAKGFCEIVLVGINLSAYGKGTDFDLCDAVNAAASPSGIKRVRLGSLEPDHMTDAMLNSLACQPKFCPQFHLSLQSGCDGTLKRMNRHYDTAFYRDLVKRIRNIFHNPSITTDVMVGFAGESDSDFKQSLAFVEEIGFAKCHIFSYSRRAGTFAYNMPGQVSEQEKANRSKEMIKTALTCEQRFLQKQIGNTEPVLFETYNKSDGFLEGYTKNYSRVKAKGCQKLCGTIQNVFITDCSAECLLGEIKKELDYELYS